MKRHLPLAQIIKNAYLGILAELMYPLLIIGLAFLIIWLAQKIY